MIKKLTKVGNSLALIMDKGTLEQLGVGEDEAVSVRLDGPSMIVQAPARTISDEEVEQSTARLTERYDDLMKRLAQ